MSESFGLACPHCEFVFPLDITVGVLGAHYETEHGIDDPTGIKLDLVVLCTRCQKTMTHERTISPTRDQYRCEPCKRTRSVSHRAAGTP